MESQHPMLELDPYIATGIIDITGAGNNNGFLKMYPNPVKDGYFYIDADFDARNVKIFNLAGVQMDNLPIINRRVDVSGFERGFI